MKAIIACFIAGMCGFWWILALAIHIFPHGPVDPWYSMPITMTVICLWLAGCMALGAFLEARGS
jgi:hypothetical protein